MQRRAFLATLAASLAPRLTWADVGAPAFLAAGKRGEAFFLHGLSATGSSLFQIALPGRGHAWHPLLSRSARHGSTPLRPALASPCRLRI